MSARLRIVVPVVLTGVFLSVVGAEPKEVKQKPPAALTAALANRQKGLDQADKKYLKARIVVESAHVAELAEALKASMEAYDLEASNLIDAALKASEAELAALECLKKKGTGTAFAWGPLAGTYSIRHRDWQGDLVLYQDGRLGRPSWGEKHRFEGRWSFEGGVLTVDWKGHGPNRYEPRLGFVSPLSTMTRRGPVSGK